MPAPQIPTEASPYGCPRLPASRYWQSSAGRFYIAKKGSGELSPVTSPPDTIVGCLDIVVSCSIFTADQVVRVPCEELGWEALLARRLVLWMHAVHGAVGESQLGVDVGVIADAGAGLVRLQHLLDSPQVAEDDLLLFW